MANEILVNVKSLNPIKEIIESNYPEILTKFGDLANLPRPINIDFFGTNSDSNQALVSYLDKYELHLFHRKKRSLLDAGFLEKSYLGCLYGPNNRPIAGVRLFHEDRGGIILATAYNHELILPYLIIPENLRRLEKSLSAQQYSQERVEKVTNNLLGACIEEVPMDILNKLSSGGKYVTDRKLDDQIMDSLNSRQDVSQRFIIEYDN